MSKSIDDILRTIRILESNENYAIPKNRGGASGAYQYIDSTWNRFLGYPSAYLAPPAVQDQKAALDVSAILATWGNDVSMVPVIWYFPKAAYDPTLMDRVPMPGAGNSLTVREYQTRWLRIYGQVSGTPVSAPAAPVHVASVQGEPPVLQRNWGPFVQVAYPLLGPSSIQPPVCIGTDTAANGSAVGPVNPATGAAAPAVGAAVDPCRVSNEVVINGQAYQPVVAVADGIIANITNQVATPVAPTDGASSTTTQPPASTGPVGLTLIDVDGRNYVYSGFNDGSNAAIPQFTSLVKVGGQVRAGQVLGYLGGSDADRPRLVDPVATTSSTVANPAPGSNSSTDNSTGSTTTTDETGTDTSTTGSTTLSADGTASTTTSTTTTTTTPVSTTVPAAGTPANTAPSYIVGPNPPQLRLAIISSDGVTVDSEGLVRAALVRQACDVASGPWATKPIGAATADATATPEANTSDATATGFPTVVPVVGGTDTDRWLISRTGALTTQGLASMIVSPEGCSVVTPDLFGPGALGSEAPAGWAAEINVETKYVVNAIAEQVRTKTPAVVPKLHR